MSFARNILNPNDIVLQQYHSQSKRVYRDGEMCYDPSTHHLMLRINNKWVSYKSIPIEQQAAADAAAAPSAPAAAAEDDTDDTARGGCCPSYKTIYPELTDATAPPPPGYEYLPTDSGVDIPGAIVHTVKHEVVVRFSDLATANGGSIQNLLKLVEYCSGSKKKLRRVIVFSGNSEAFTDFTAEVHNLLGKKMVHSKRSSLTINV